MIEQVSPGEELSETEKKTWTFLAAVGEYSKGKFKARCGGVVVCENWVLTAGVGHCADCKDVVVGVHDLDAVKKKDRIRIVERRCHPSLDVALMKLGQPVSIGSVYMNTDKKNEVVGKLGVVAGWGRLGVLTDDGDLTLEDGLPRIIRKVDLIVREASYCPKIDHVHHLCAGGVGKGVCVGDSGSGFFMNVKDAAGSDRFCIVGVVSDGNACPDEHGEIEDKPSVFVKVSCIKTWAEREFKKSKIESKYSC